MERITSNYEVGSMGMLELAHNCCYVKDREARYRDYDTDISARDLARNLMVSYGHWKSCEKHGLDSDNELVDDDIFDDTMLWNCTYDPKESIGLIALLYRNLWAMADLHYVLKEYEDSEEQGMLLKLPCTVGDTVYEVQSVRNRIQPLVITSVYLGRMKELFFYWELKDGLGIYKNVKGFGLSELGKTVFLTREEAEQHLLK